MGAGCCAEQLGPDASKPLWYAHCGLYTCAKLLTDFCVATSSVAIPRENESNAFLSQFEGMS